MDKEMLYNLFSSQSFSDWYSGAFEEHISGDDNCKTKEEIMSDIEQMLGGK